MIWVRWIAIVAACVVALAIGAWIFRVPILGAVIGSYFDARGVASSVQIGDFGREGVSARIALGDSNAPALSADNIEVRFDPQSWVPLVTEIRVTNPVLHARMDADGKITLPPLQDWIDSLTRNAQTNTHSRFVSDDLVITLSNARAFLATPDGALKIDGNARIEHNMPVAAQFVAKPTNIYVKSNSVHVAAATFQTHAVRDGYAASVQVSGSINDGNPQAALRVTGVDASFATPLVRWVSVADVLKIAVSSASMKVSAQSLSIAGVDSTKPTIDFAARNIAGVISNGTVEGDADFSTSAQTNLARDKVRDIVRLLPGVGADPALVEALVDDSGELKLTATGHVELANGKTGLRLTAPASLQGANNAMLRIASLAVEYSPGGMTGTLDAQLSAGGLPAIALTSHKFVWANDNGAPSFDADTALRASFDFGLLRGVGFSALGNAALHNGAFTFALSQCAPAKLGAIQIGRKTGASRVAGTVCTSGKQPLFASTAEGWTVAAQAKNLSADIPLAVAKLSNADATLAFSQRGNARLSGTVKISAMRISDEAKTNRFLPIVGTGTITLANNVVNGRAILADSVYRVHIGDVTFTHAIASGVGKADIDARDIVFESDQLQPPDLSPLLASVTRATGHAKFSGTVAWTPNGTNSHGILNIAQLDFATPLGTAHALHSSIVLKSLLPPTTESGQKLDIAKIDWTLPFTDVNTVFEITPDLLHIEATKTNVAKGSASLDAFAVKFADATKIAGTARLAHIDLAQVVAATNIGDKVKVEGSVSGAVPFTSGPEGFRIAKGHIESDGPGRLAIDRTLWTKGVAVTNGVQDFAYQALENLAVDSMTADIDSIPNGRLQILFHIKGHSDPPKPQEARVGLVDLLRGTAFDKPIALPKGTPIDLTLDTSLNFDELLQSYREAWSNAVVQAPKPQPVRGKKK